MTHIETLEFELQALRNVLNSQEATLATYLALLNREDPKSLQAASCRSVINEYEKQHIPRTKRHIEALDYLLRRYEDLTNGAMGRN